MPLAAMPEMGVMVKMAEMVAKVIILLLATYIMEPQVPEVLVAEVLVQGLEEMAGKGEVLMEVSEVTVARWGPSIF